MVAYRKSEHQMSEIEQDAFEEHCKASETYKTVKLNLYAEKLRWLKAIEPTGEMALDDFDRWAGNELERFAYDDSRYKTIKVKGYDKDASLPCYPCATQRHKCEHDDNDDYPEDWKDV